MAEKRSPAVVAVGAVMLLFLGVLYAWSIFRVQLAAQFPDFSAAQLSMNFTITMICFCVGGFAGGKLSAWKTPGFSARVSAVMFLAGFMGVSFMERLSGSAALAVMYIFYGGLAGLGAGIGYNACIGGVSPWFPQRLGLVSGILLMGYGFGSLFLGLLAEALAKTMSVFVIFRIFAVAICIVTFAGSFALKKPPVREKTEDTASGCTPRQMLCRPSFWVYFLWNVVLSSSGLLVFNSSANIAVFYGAAASLGLIVSVFNGAGRPVIGALMDRVGQLKGMMISNSTLIVAGLLLILGAFTDSAVAVIAGLVIVGICYGSGVAISAKVINDLYGSKHYAVNFSLSNFCMIPAAFIGPYISGMLQDSSGGEYTSTFFLLLGLGVFAFLLIFPLKLLVKRERSR